MLLASKTSITSSTLRFGNNANSKAVLMPKTGQSPEKTQISQPVSKTVKHPIEITEPAKMLDKLQKLNEYIRPKALSERIIDINFPYSTESVYRVSPECRVEFSDKIQMMGKDVTLSVLKGKVIFKAYGSLLEYFDSIIYEVKNRDTQTITIDYGNNKQPVSMSFSSPGKIKRFLSWLFGKPLPVDTPQQHNIRLQAFSLVSHWAAQAKQDQNDIEAVKTLLERKRLRDEISAPPSK